MKKKDDEKKKSKTDNDEDFGFLLSIFDFLSWL